jgi:hypothetical protein
MSPSSRTITKMLVSMAKGACLFVLVDISHAAKRKKLAQMVSNETWYSWTRASSQRKRCWRRRKHSFSPEKATKTNHACMHMRAKNDECIALAHCAPSTVLCALYLGLRLLEQEKDSHKGVKRSDDHTKPLALPKARGQRRRGGCRRVDFWLVEG